MTLVAVADELALDQHTDSPVAGRTFTHWPLPVGLVELRDGLAFVHSAEPGGFTIDDYYRIPDGGRIELLDGVAVVSPAPSHLHQRVAGNIYMALRQALPRGFEVLFGPFDVYIRPGKMFEPDVVVLRIGSEEAVLAVEVLSKFGRSYDRHVKRRGYEERGVPSYRIVDPDAPSVTVLELTGTGHYEETGFFHGDDLCALDRPFPVRLRPSDLVVAPPG
jgi:Uma2 family endonuclease